MDLRTLSSYGSQTQHSRRSSTISSYHRTRSSHLKMESSNSLKRDGIVHSSISSKSEKFKLISYLLNAAENNILIQVSKCSHYTSDMQRTCSQSCLFLKYEFLGIQVYSEFKNSDFISL